MNLLLSLLVSLLFEQSYLHRMPISTQHKLRTLAKKFNFQKSFNIQIKLFREDLIWQGRGLSKRQLDVIVFEVAKLIYEFSLKKIKKAECELGKLRKAENQLLVRKLLERRFLERKLLDLRLFSLTTEAYIEREKEKNNLKDIKDYELKFYL